MWEQIRSNRIRSIILVIGMGILLLLVGYFLGEIFLGSPITGLVIAFLLWGVMNLIAYFQGDIILLSVSGAHKISPEDHPRLYNVVEEMKIASGLPKMPDIYIIDDPALNAFATGRDENHAAIAITSGLLQKLNRDELQGVIAHEMSHIRNRDVLLMALASVLLGTIIILAWYASRVMFFSGAPRSRRSSDRGGGGGAQIILLVVGLVLVILAPIFAQLLYFAISRRREYLADASGALYTRYPEGLASALEKIANEEHKVQTANQATAPMYIINPFGKRGVSVQDLMSTHPPIQERVRILRSMGGASYLDYEKAYEQTHKGKAVLPPSVRGVSETVPLRAPSQAAAAGELNEIQRARETSNVLWNMSNYKIIDCPCGTKLRVPPAFHGSAVRCPHCGRTHQV